MRLSAEIVFFALAVGTLVLFLLTLWKKPTSGSFAAAPLMLGLFVAASFTSLGSLSTPQPAANSKQFSPQKRQQLAELIADTKKKLESLKYDLNQVAQLQNEIGDLLGQSASAVESSKKTLVEMADLSRDEYNSQKIQFVDAKMENLSKQAKVLTSAGRDLARRRFVPIVTSNNLKEQTNDLLNALSKLTEALDISNLSE